MAKFALIPIKRIYPPLKPMRIDSLGEGLEELKEDLDRRGQLQAIGVVDLGGEEYRLVWGSRRTAAAEELGWTEIYAKVHALDEIDELEAMAAENFQRTDVSPIEEAEFYAALMEQKGISSAEVARRCHRSRATVETALAFLSGDPAVKEALGRGEINKGQATQLNLVKDDIGRAQGLGWARQGLLTAKQLEGWRVNREVTGISESIEKVKENLDALPPVDYRTQTRCLLHNEFVALADAYPRVVCNECWSLVLDALQFMHDHGGHAEQGGN